MAYNAEDFMNLGFQWIIQFIDVSANQFKIFYDDLKRKQEQKIWGDFLSEEGTVGIVDTSRLPVKIEDVQKIAQNIDVPIHISADGKTIMIAEKDIEFLFSSVQTAYKNGEIGIFYKDLKTQDEKYISLYDIKKEVEQIKKELNKLGIDEEGIIEYPSIDCEKIFGHPIEVVKQTCVDNDFYFKESVEDKTFSIHQSQKDILSMCLENKYYSFTLDEIEQICPTTELAQLCEDSDITYFIEIDKEQNSSIFIYPTDLSKFQEKLKEYIILNAKDENIYETIFFKDIDISQQEISSICRVNNIDVSFDPQNLSFSVKKEDYSLLRQKVLEMLAKENNSIEQEILETINDNNNIFNDDESDYDISFNDDFDSNSSDDNITDHEIEQDLEPEIINLDDEDDFDDSSSQKTKKKKGSKSTLQSDIQNAVAGEYLYDDFANSNSYTEESSQYTNSSSQTEQYSAPSSSESYKAETPYTSNTYEPEFSQEKKYQSDDVDYEFDSKSETIYPNEERIEHTAVKIDSSKSFINNDNVVTIKETPISESTPITINYEQERKKDLYGKTIEFNDGTTLRVENGKFYDNNNTQIESLQAKNKETFIEKFDEYTKKHGNVSTTSYIDTVKHVNEVENKYNQLSQSNDTYAEQKYGKPESKYGSNYPSFSTQQNNQQTLNYNTDKFNTPTQQFNSPQGSSYNKPYNQAPLNYADKLKQIDTLNQRVNKSNISNLQSNTAYGSSSLSERLKETVRNTANSYQKQQNGHQISELLFKEQQSLDRRETIIAQRKNEIFDIKISQISTQQVNYNNASMNSFGSSTSRLASATYGKIVSGTTFQQGMNSTNTLRRVTSAAVLGNMSGYNSFKAIKDFKDLQAGTDKYSRRLNKLYEKDYSLRVRFAEKKGLPINNIAKQRYNAQENILKELSKHKINTIKVNGKEINVRDLFLKHKFSKENKTAYQQLLVEYAKKCGGKMSREMLVFEKAVKGLTPPKNIRSFRVAKIATDYILMEMPGYQDLRNIKNAIKTSKNLASTARRLHGTFSRFTSAQSRINRLNTRMANMNRNSSRYQRATKKLNRLKKQNKIEQGVINRRKNIQSRVRNSKKNLTNRIQNSKLGQRLSAPANKARELRDRLKKGFNDKFKNSKLGKALLQKINLPAPLKKLLEKAMGLLSKLGSFFSTALIYVGLALIIYIVICLILWGIISIGHSFDQDRLANNYKYLLRMQTALTDPSSLNLVGDNNVNTLSTLSIADYYATPEDPYYDGYSVLFNASPSNSDENLDSQGNSLWVRGNIRLKDNAFATYDDLIADTTIHDFGFFEGEKVAGKENNEYFLYGWYSHNTDGTKSERTKLYNWYNCRIEGTNYVPHYDGTVLCPVKENMLSRTGLSSNLVSILAMSVYAFNQDLGSDEALQDDTTFEGLYVNLIQSGVENFTPKDNWAFYYVDPARIESYEGESSEEDDEEDEETTEAEDTYNSAPYYVIVEYTSDQNIKPSLEDVEQALGSGALDATFTYPNETSPNGTFILVDSSIVDQYLRDQGFDLTTTDYPYTTMSRQERITAYMEELYNFSHVMNLSFATTSWNEQTMGGSTNLTETVDQSQNAEIFKLHESEWNADEVGNETRIKDVSSEGNKQVCGFESGVGYDDGSETDTPTIIDYLSHEGITNLMQEETEYIDDYTARYTSSSSEPYVCINDLEILNRLAQFCKEEHYIPPVYEYTFTCDIDVTETYTVTVEDDPETEEDESSNSSETHTFTIENQTTTFKAYKMGSDVTNTAGNYKEGIDEDLIYANAVVAARESLTANISCSDHNGTCSTSISNVNCVQGTLMEEGYYICDKADYSGSYHKYAHCGGHFYINLELYTANMNGSDGSNGSPYGNIFYMDDKTEDNDTLHRSLAQKYGEYWAINTEDSNRWYQRDENGYVIVDGKKQETKPMEFAREYQSSGYELQLETEGIFTKSHSMKYTYKLLPMANNQEYKVFQPIYSLTEGGDTYNISVGSPLSAKEIKYINDYIYEATGDNTTIVQFCNYGLEAVGNIGYYYGGTSLHTSEGSFPSGLDCSGFVSWMFYQFNYHSFLNSPLLYEKYMELYPNGGNMQNFTQNFVRLNTTGFANSPYFETITDPSQLKPGDILLKTSGAASAFTSTNHTAVYLGKFKRVPDTGQVLSGTSEDKDWYVQEGGNEQNVNIRCSTNIFGGGSGEFNMAVRFKYFDEIEEAFDLIGRE